MKISNKIKITLLTSLVALIIISFAANSGIRATVSCYHNGVYYGKVTEEGMCLAKHQLIGQNIALHTGTDPEECEISKVHNEGTVN